MTDREIMQQALEALELVTDLTNHDDAIYAAIDALRERLAQPEQEPVIDHSCKDAYELIMKWADIYAVQTGCIYSEAAQDPSKVARMADERTMLACVVAQTLSQQAQPEQEPVIDKSAAVRIATALGWEPKRTWQRLTDEEIALICGECAASAHKTDDISYARAIEAKLKEKNT